MAKNPEHLPPYKKWDWLWRSTFELDYRGSVLVADVDFFDVSEKIRLFRDGKFVAVDSSPARLRVDDYATVEAALSLYEMQYVRLDFLGRLLDFTVPTFELPRWLNLALQIGGFLAGLDRALRMRFNPWIDDTHL